MVLDYQLLHDEVKAKRTVVLTPTAWENIKLEAQRRGLSASELIEDWGRRINSQFGRLTVTPAPIPHK